MKKVIKGLTLGNRIPKDYFVTTGYGETDKGSGINPWKTGAYDLALTAAQIENFNIVAYTSVLPPEAKEWPIHKVKHLFHHGAVLETIMASINGYQYDHLCAGVGRIQVRRKSDGFHIGGFAAEYEGHAPKGKAKESLHNSLMGIVERRYNLDDYEWFDERFDIVHFDVQKKFGTALAVIGFVTYVYPDVLDMKNPDDE